MSVLPKLELHDFVLVDNGLGLGQVTSIDSGLAEVSYFESTANPRADTVAAHVDALRAVALKKKQRCFVHAGGCWWAGRVEDREGRRYLVRFRGGERWIDGRDLRVRWSRALADPLDDLIGVNWWAHPVEVALRREFLKRCGRQRRQVLGLSGLSSLVAEVHAHQIEVARRVLEDPVGRFLLADEVGLGKTIEALFIIRQFLLDDPESRIRVIAPAALCSQWREELGRRAFVAVDGGDFPYAHVEVLSMGDPQSWSGSTVVDLLVIDEAHRVAAWAHSPSDGARRSYAAAQELTGRAASVILISATPSLHSSGTFLALLHLLDPQRHDLDDLEGFEAMLARRDEVASALLALDTGDPVEILVDSLSDLARTIPAEAELRQEIMTLAKDLEVTTEVDEAVRSRLERLKLEVAESFRVDRRMLRTRRRAVERRFPVRGRQPGSELHIESSGFRAARTSRARSRSCSRGTA